MMEGIDEDYDIFDREAESLYYEQIRLHIAKPFLIDKYLVSLPVHWEISKSFLDFCLSNYKHYHGRDDVQLNEMFGLVCQVIITDFFKGDNDYITTLHKPKRWLGEKKWKIFLSGGIFERILVSHYDIPGPVNHSVGTVYHSMPPQDNVEMLYDYYDYKYNYNQIEWCEYCEKYEYTEVCPTHMGIKPGDAELKFEDRCAKYKNMRKSPPPSHYCTNACDAKKEQQ
jgi:hypothetical protein